MEQTIKLGTVNTFVCDKSKARSNFQKHGLRFTEACRIFEGLTLTSESKQNADSREMRYVSIGALDEESAAVVVWTERARDIRVISSRKASRKERKRYNDHIKKTIN